MKSFSLFTVLLALLALISNTHADFDPLLIAVNGSSGPDCVSSFATTWPMWNFSTIQAAVNNASTGYTIYICKNSTYAYGEQVKVNVSVNIYGNQSRDVNLSIPTTTTILFNVTSNWVNITNLSFNGGDGTSSAFASGILLSSSNYSKIYNNSFTKNYYNIYLYNSNNVTVENNSIDAKQHGSASQISIYLNSSSMNNITNNSRYTSDGSSVGDASIKLVNSTDNLITGNNISSGVGTGAIWLKSDSPRNNLTSNVMTTLGSTSGIHINSSYNVLVNNTVRNHGGSGIYSDASNNNYTNNRVYMDSNRQYGYRFVSSDNNTLFGNAVLSNNPGSSYSANLAGFSFETSSNNQIINATASQTELSNLRLITGSNNNTIQGLNGSAFQSGYGTNGVVISASYNNTLRDSNFTNISGGSVGVAINLTAGAGNNTISNNTIFTGINTAVGISTNSENNTVKDNIFYAPLVLGFHIGPTAKYNAIYNNTVKKPVTQGFQVNGGSSNNFFENNTVINCVSYCYYFLNVTKINLTGNNATNGLVGFYFANGSGVIAVNNTAFNSSQNGFYSDINDSAFINNTAARSNGSGFNFTSYSFGINFTNNTAFNNSYAGIAFARGSNFSNLTNNTAYRNFIGLYILNTNDTRIDGDHYYNNSFDIRIEDTVNSNRLVNLSRVIIDSPRGDYTNYSNISINMTLYGNSAFIINWSNLTNLVNLPNSNYVTFANKFLNITNVTSNITFTNVAWHWQQSEVTSGYVENLFQVWKYNHTGVWNQLTTTLDTAGNSISVSNINSFSLFALLQLNDSAPPVVTLNSPVAHTAFSTSTINFNFTVTDDVDTSINCSIYVDAVMNESNSSTFNNSATNITVTSIPQGNHTWFVQCDDGINFANATARNFTVDTTAPSIALSTPVANNITNTTTTGNFFFTPTDNVASIFNCSVSVDGTLVASNTSTINNTLTNISVSSLSQGNHTWFSSCSDLANNSVNSSATNFTIDTVAPAVTLNSPVAHTVFSSSTVNFNITATDNLALAMNCSIFVDGALNLSNTSIINNTASNLSLTNIAQGNHTWYSVCLDTANNSITSSARNFTVDTTVPTVTLSTPVAHNISNITTVNFAFTPSDNTIGAMNCSLFVDGIIRASNASTINNTLTNLSLTSLGQGNHTWFTACSDLANNSANASAQNFSVDNVAPTVTLNSPVNHTAFSSSTVNFNITATDNLDLAMNCSIFVDGGLNLSNTSTLNNSATNLSLTGIGQGNHTWYSVCLDMANNSITTGSRNFTVDTTVPAVTLDLPVANNISNVSTMNFSFTPTDNTNGALNCSLTVDGTLRFSNTSTQNNTVTNISLTSLGEANHTYVIGCSDLANNSVNSSAT
ncbi:MAG: right-handed parallel beta-helix repeat-containing protein, partial [Candidatus Micrarchaeota archaeon]